MNAYHSRSCGFESFCYQPVERFAVVTAYYNPCGYSTRYNNYQVFAETLERSGIPLYTVECAFGSESFTLPDDLRTIKLRSKSLLWQKERLINLGISYLPPSYHYIAWLDCDLLFLNENWAIDTVALLQRYPMVQVFETVNRMPQSGITEKHKGNIAQSFCTIAPHKPEVMYTGRFEDHGHTGYGWAARREILDQHGLYELAVAGSADYYMAHAAMGDFDGINIRRVMNNDDALLQHFTDWAQPFYNAIAGNITATPGEVLHLWHGELTDRKHMERHIELALEGFNPFTDIAKKPGRPLEWNPKLNKPGLIRMFDSYFANRNEDGKLRATA